MTKILFFGRLTELFGREIEVVLPDADCLVSVLREIVYQRFPGTRGALEGRVKVAADHVVLAGDARVRREQEIAFLPPLSGG